MHMSFKLLQSVLIKAGPQIIINLPTLLVEESAGSTSSIATIPILGDAQPTLPRFPFTLSLIITTAGLNSSPLLKRSLFRLSP